jgi:hypothetical protein
MSTISISDLRPTGSDLFIDSENYLRELSGNELMINHGGSVLETLIITTVVGTIAAAVSAAVGYYTNREPRQPCRQN